MLLFNFLKTNRSRCNYYYSHFQCAVILLFINLIFGCGSDTTVTERPNPNQTPIQTSTPVDSYFSLAVTENSSNHTGARSLFLDFQDSSADRSVIQNNIVISPKISSGTINMDGDSSDWNHANLTTVNGLVQNNYPLSEFIDATQRDITVGSAWDNNYVYFLVQWEDAGHSKSTKFEKWIYGDQGSGESGWNYNVNRGVTAGAPNENIVNAAHTLAGSENEDRILLMFPVTDSEGNFSENGLGCAAYCHANLIDDNSNQNYTGSSVAVMHTNVSGDVADIWNWKSLRTGAEGYADDEYIAYAQNSDSGRISDSGTSAYSSNSLSADNPTSMHTSGLSNSDDFLNQADAISFSGSPTAGDEVPSILGRTPVGSRADVQTRASYNDSTHVWTVEFRRLRNTGNSDDRQFINGTDAQRPGNATVSSTNISTGNTLYNSHCSSCHQMDGVGAASGSGWSFPRVQRTSGSLILKALEDVDAMRAFKTALGSTPQEIEQAVEHIAAYLQDQATFESTNSLTVTVNGTTLSNAVTSSGANINCPTNCSSELIAGTSATLTANNLTGYIFSSWSGDCAGTSSTCGVTLNSDLSVVANYSVVATNYTVTVNGSANGSVSDGSGIDCGSDCTETYADGSEITLTATPATGYQFNSWSGDACSGQTTTTCQFTLSADTTVTPSYSMETPSCANKNVIYDDNGTNGYGLQMMIDEGTVSNPTDLAFVPGSSTDFLVLAQSGYVYFFDGGCTPANYIDLRSTGSGSIGVVNGGEQGLLNVEFHPDYNGTSNKYIFFYHTTINRSVNSVSRMTVDFVSEELVLSDPVKIIDFHKVGSAGNHNGGGLVFAPDNTLLASIGDGGSGSANNSQVNTNLLGTVIRVNPSLTAATGGYTIPSGNMFPSTNAQCTSTSSNGDNCPEILAIGLRNPYRMSIDGNIVYLGEVGSSYEEINSFDYTNNTFNFAWNDEDGPCDPCSYDDPIISYRRNDSTANRFRDEDPACPTDSGCDGSYASVITGDVYRGSRYDGELTGRLFHAEFMDGYMRGAGVNSSGATTDSGMHVIHHDGISAMVEGPDEYVYIVTQEGAWRTGDADIVYRLVKQNAVAKGEAYFRENCTSCHTFGHGDHLGPDLSSRNMSDWSSDFLRDPADILANTSYGQYLLSEWGYEMPDFNLTEEEISNLQAFFTAQDGIGPLSFTAPDTLTSDEFEEAKGIYFNHCAGCHGLYRTGATGPDIGETRSSWIGTDGLETLLKSGTPRGMPNFGESGILTEDEISKLASFLQQAPPVAPALPMSEIQASWNLLIPEASRPVAPVTTRDWENFVGVVLRDEGKIAIFDGDNHDEIVRLDVGFAVHILRSSATGRYFYAIGRDGVVTMIDLWPATPNVVAQVKGCHDARSVDGSKYTGYEDQFLIEGCYWPPQYVTYNGLTLEPLSRVDLPMTDINGGTLIENRVAAIVASTYAPVWVVNQKESGYIGIVDYSQAGAPLVTNIATERFLHDGGWDHTKRYFITAANASNKIVVIDVENESFVTSFEVGSTPHPGRGANWEDPVYGWVNATPHIGSPFVSVYGADPAGNPDNAWKVVREIAIPAAGSLFIKTHPNSPWVLVDMTLSATNDKQICAINKATGLLDSCFDVAIAGKAVHMEFNNDGSEVWISDWATTGGGQVILDGTTLAVIERISLPATTGKFNVYNTAHDVY